jgi:hypothetical protein
MGIGRLGDGGRNFGCVLHALRGFGFRCGSGYCRGFSFISHVAYYAAGEWSEGASGLEMIHICGSSRAVIAD